MEKTTGERAGDRTEGERRKDLSDDEVKALDLAGGVEGGMQAGSAGGPSAGDRKAAPADEKPRSER